MTFDLLFWKPRKKSKASRGLIALILSEGLPCTHIGKFPAASVRRAIESTFGGPDSIPFEFELSASHLWAGLGWGDDARAHIAFLTSLASNEGLTMYDLQEEKPSPEDRATFETLKTPPDADSPDSDFAMWLEEAENGKRAEMHKVANAYRYGSGVTKDIGKAIAWYELAASAGLHKAFTALAEIHRDGEGVAQDAQKAFAYYSKGSALGHLPSAIMLAECHEKGVGVPKNVRAAIKILEDILPQDGCVAAYELGRIHETGDGISQSKDRAADYYRMARANRHPEAYRALKRLGLEP